MKWFNTNHFKYRKPTNINSQCNLELKIALQINAPNPKITDIDERLSTSLANNWKIDDITNFISKIAKL